ncbi:hypothetical protein CDD83_2849 [Cordyceps sp. RAO-2017]|nr:hypothetical protein CDD83_2849 [Cordyceps sp. RAO-2017]
MRPSAALLLAAPAAASTVTLYLPSQPNPFALPARTHATLVSLGARAAAPLSAVNTFVFRNVTPGSYLVDVHCPVEAFRPLRLDVAAAADAPLAAWETFRGNGWDDRGEALPLREGSAGPGFELRPLGRKQYFLERPRFSILSILKNPMILMGLVSMLLFIGMPYLLDNMDPEMKAEFEAQQRKGPMAAMMGGAGGGQQAANPLGNFDMAAFLAGSKPREDAAAAADDAAAADGPARNQGVRR